MSTDLQATPPYGTGTAMVVSSAGYKIANNRETSATFLGTPAEITGRHSEASTPLSVWNRKYRTNTRGSATASRSSEQSARVTNYNNN